MLFIYQFRLPRCSQRQYIPDRRLVPEQFAEEDKKKRESVDLRNNADQMVYQTEKLISEDGDKFSADDKSALQTKVDALKEALRAK